ncbi:Sensor histidine kinase RcsC [Mycovorax composti]|jgi:Response regulators consisting of a CheY-like receiver domain and a winged-helix DNA-binding domain|uniref:Sensor histidine kinase RcsC n=2 Tax=Chitinophagaceae TaxID=563835 RepID=A0ABZ2EGN9_9BACT
MKQHSILIVDDDAFIVDLLSDLLDVEFKVFSALNGDDAIKILNSLSVSLIISDVVMPGKDGLDLCNFVKNTPHLSHIPVILLSAKSEEENKIQGLHEGADVYIEKPFSPSYVKAQVVSIIENRTRILSFISPKKTHGDNLITEEEYFINQLNNIIDENIAYPELNLNLLAQILHMSRASLYRKIKSLAHCTPNELIEDRRLNQAVTLINQGFYKMNEIAFLCGFTSASQFTKSFKRKFGQSPLNYARLHKLRV